MQTAVDGIAAALGRVALGQETLIEALRTLRLIHYSAWLARRWNDPAFHLQSQTNAPGAGLSTGWADHPGGATSPVNVPVGQAPGSVLFRLSN